jgi:hypothetical protein
MRLMYKKEGGKQSSYKKKSDCHSNARWCRSLLQNTVYSI